jgi:glycosyltransferase involved in cell wall biosynthesis
LREKTDRRAELALCEAAFYGITMKISVIIPNYNSGKYLGKCLDSVFRQTYQDFEVIVADGHSTDNSAEILKRFQKLRKNLKVVYRVSKGTSDNINAGMKLATGDVVGYLCADDAYEPNCLETVAEYFRKPEVQWAYGKSKIIDGEGREIRRLITKAKEIFQKRYSYVALQCVDFIVQLTVFLRRQFYQQVGEYNVDLKYGMDYDYCLRAGRVSKPVFIDEYLANWRAHSESTSEKEHVAEAKQAFEIQKRYSKWWLRSIQRKVRLLTILLYWVMSKSK